MDTTGLREIPRVKENIAIAEKPRKLRNMEGLLNEVWEGGGGRGLGEDGWTVWTV